MYKRRTITSLLTLGLATALVAGCGGGTQPTGPGGETGSAGGDASSGGATVWGLTGGVNEQLHRESFAAWNEANPDREFAIEFFNNDAYKEKVRTAVGSGNAPTLIYGWGGGGLQEYVDNGNVVDLTEGTTNVQGRVMDSVLAGGKSGDSVYAIPMSQSQPVVMYYNKDLFAQVGADVPTTWDELLDVIPMFNDAGIAPFSVAGLSKWPYLMWIQYLTDRIGGPEAFQAVLDNEPDAWSNPAFAEALTKIQELVEADAFVSGYGSVAADANADLALVYTGKAAMLLQGSWVYSTFKADAPEFTSETLGFTTFPTLAGGKGDPSNIVGNLSNFWSISSTATPEQQANAMEYLDTMVFNDEYTEILLAGGGVPPVVGLEDRIAEIEDSEFVGLAYGMMRDADHFQLSWDQALPSAPAQDLLTNLEKIFLMQITPEEFVDAMNATIK